MFQFSKLSVDDALENLARLRRDHRFSSPPTTMTEQIQTFQLELELLRMSIEFVADDYDWNVQMTQRLPSLYDTGFWAICTAKFEDWNFAVWEWLEQIKHVKPSIGQHLLDESFNCSFTDLFRLIHFTDVMLKNLKYLVRLNSDEIKALEEKLKLLQQFTDFVRTRCTHQGELENYFSYSRDQVYKAALRFILYWIDGVQEQNPSTLNGVVIDLLEMIKPWTPKVTGMYLQVLKASKSSDSENLLTGEVVANVVDFLLESAVLPVEEFENLRDGLIILLTFLMNPPKCTEHQKLGKIQKEINAILAEAAFIISSLSIQKTNAEVSKEFLKKIAVVVAERIKRSYFDSSRLNFPRTNVIGFVDFLLENLGNLKERVIHNSKYIPFAKYQIVAIHKELMRIKPFLETGMQVDPKVLQKKVIIGAYQADFVLDSCQTIGFPIWRTMISLSHLIKQFQIIQETRSQEIGFSSVEIHSSKTLHEQSSISRVDEVVGFEDMTDKIIDELTNISLKELKIISIVGMPGIGKTTLAKKVFDDARVQYHFHKCAWCVVSQSYQYRALLLTILNDLAVDGVSNMNEDDFTLAAKLKRSLWGHKYLIVLDDVWDARALEELKGSFPDGGQGSRIFFTSRNGNIALRDNCFYNAYRLRLLNDQESLLLLEKRLKLKNGIPSKLSKVAEQIVDVCKGLPLSIVVVAGLLVRESSNLGWSNIAEELHPKLVGRSMNILQLSYKHLPDYLKPCFLYFSALREDQEIDVQKLTQLWIPEGFIREIDERSKEDVAMEYLMDLVERSLVIIAKRSAIGEVKTCRIHDLLHELCLKRAREENFLYSLHLDDNAFNSIKYDQYRLSIHGENSTSLSSNLTSSSIVRTLLVWSDISCPLLGNVSVFNFLRVLNFDSFLSFRCLRPEILLLIHLRYLGICGLIRDVPSSISNLENLETLRISSSGSRIFFPASFWMMKNLRHVDLSGSTAVIVLGHELAETSQLENLDSFSWLSLHFLQVMANKMLRRFPRVTKLSIIQQVYSEDFIHFPVMDFLCKLESLRLYFDRKVYHTCPFSFPTTLKKLTLSNFGRPWSEMSVIGKLPSLEVLKLLAGAFIGEKWDMEDEQFLNLRYLKLQKLDIVEWNVSDDSFTYLEALVVKNCSDLKEIPSPLQELSNLKVIKVCGCSKAASSASRILEEQQNMRNEALQVLIKNNKDLRLKLWKKWLNPRNKILQMNCLDPDDFEALIPFRVEIVSKKKVHRKVCLQDMIQRFAADIHRKVHLQGIIPRLTADNFVKKIDFTKVESKSFVKKMDITKVESKRRMKFRSTYNCQSRQAIIPRYCHQSLK